MFARAAVAVLTLQFLFPLAAFAQTQPFSFAVDRFEVPERGIADDFDDGMIGPGWDGTILGTVVESGSTVTLSNPGAFGFLPDPLVSETSVLSGQGVQLDFGGDMTATATWTQVLPPPSTGLNLSIGSLDLAGNVHQLSIGLSDVSPDVAAILGGDSGLVVSVLSVVRDSPSGNIHSLSRTSTPILPTEITGDILTSLAFDDTANTMTPTYSLDGGATVQSALPGGLPWSFSGGGFSISGSSTVPEPGTGLLLSLGLVALAAGRRRCGR